MQHWSGVGPLSGCGDHSHNYKNEEEGTREREREELSGPPLPDFQKKGRPSLPVACFLPFPAAPPKLYLFQHVMWLSTHYSSQLARIKRNPEPTRECAPPQRDASRNPRLGPKRGPHSLLHSPQLSPSPSLSLSPVIMLIKT